jgi:hypothetical protein
VSKMFSSSGSPLTCCSPVIDGARQFGHRGRRAGTLACQGIVLAHGGPFVMIGNGLTGASTKIFAIGEESSSVESLPRKVIHGTWAHELRVEAVKTL